MFLGAKLPPQSPLGTTTLDEYHSIELPEMMEMAIELVLTELC